MKFRTDANVDQEKEQQVDSVAQTDTPEKGVDSGSATAAAVLSVRKRRGQRRFRLPMSKKSWGACSRRSRRSKSTSRLATTCASPMARLQTSSARWMS